MTVLSSLEYLKLTKIHKIIYRFLLFFYNLPKKALESLKKAGRTFKKIGLKIGNEFKDIVNTFIHGSWMTKVSYFVMGFGSIMRGQVLRGILFFIFEVAFILYMVLFGGPYLAQFGTLGEDGSKKVEILNVGGIEMEVETVVPGGKSISILLYCLISLIVLVAFIYTWRVNVKQNRIAEEILASGKKLKSGKDDLRSIIDDQFHKTLLALPLTGILFFTVLPIIFMILVAFTNFDVDHQGNGYGNSFNWVGFQNFIDLFGGAQAKDPKFAGVFGKVLLWTLVWAFFATFTNYFLGMFVAMMINKKGIRLKKFWRGVLVLTIAIPQFISLLYVSRLFADNGVINGLLLEWGWIDSPILFWKDKTLSRVLIIIINIWIGIPYLMLMATGILMNIPQDLYESAKIDGANTIQQFSRITFPYMLFVTGPYLLTNFVGNINNFNVIFLLTNGQKYTDIMDYGTVSAGTPLDTDLLITWLFNIALTQNNYKIAAVMSILIFVLIAVLSLIVYQVIPSTRNEEDFQ